MTSGPTKPSRPSLSTSQIRDPIGTLAAAYAVGRDFGVVEVAFSRVGTKSGVGSPDYVAVFQVLGIIAEDGQNLGRSIEEVGSDGPFRRSPSWR